MKNFSPDLVPLSVKVHVENIQQIRIEYKKVHDFMKNCVSPERCLGNIDKQFKGVYLDAFCVGALSVLRSVNLTLNRIQENILDNSWLHYNECEYLLCVLASFTASMEMIKSGKFYGCKILNLCDNFINCGMPSVKNVFLKIQNICLKKLYMQTKFWIMQATLHDPFNEFFIKSTKTSSLSQGIMNTGTNSISSSTLISTVTHSTSCATLMIPTTNSVSLSSFESQKYEIDADNLPSLIPFSVAVKILFIGEALIIFQKNKGNLCKNNLLEDCGISEESVLSQFKEIECCEYFILKEFNNLIDELWIKINKRMREISEEIGNISSELVMLSDIYLLGRNDLIQEFLLNASHLLSADVTSISSRNLNTVLRDAFYNVYLADIVDKFYFVLPNRKSLKPGIKAISVLSLEYNVKWPLNYLFTRDVMRKYNKIFRFLMALKKAQIVMTSACKRTNLIDEHSSRTEFIEVKMHLLSIVVNLQNYCLTNVITHEMNTLLIAVKKTDMFTDLQKIFSSFLFNISNRLFISNLFQSGDRSADSRVTEVLVETNKKVYHCFEKIFVLCNLFSELLSGDMEGVTVKLHAIKTDLYKVLKILFSLLEKIDRYYWYDDDGSVGHLFNLIMCLDYNKFYQKIFHLNFDG